MAESRGVYEHFRSAWPMLAAIGGCLVWFGRNVQTGGQVDERIRVLIRPLQIRDEWFEKELRKHQKQKFHPALAEEMRRLEQRMYQLEPRK